MLFLIFNIAFTYLKAQTKPIIEWVQIPAGTFIMGSPEEEQNRIDDENQHQVTLSAFKISKYEITFEQYDAFCEATGREKPNDQGWGRGKHPVVNVSWEDANAFAEWMGCRLPTEAQWEYACRAGTTSPYYTGNCLDANMGNWCGKFPPPKGCKKGKFMKKAMPVGSYPPNPWGLYDMHGNVEEWCNDWYKNSYPNEPQTDPVGPGETYNKVARDHGWNGMVEYCRSANRNYHDPQTKEPGLGFRVVAVE